MKKLLGITGTTCVGKSAVAVKLAQMLDCDVVSADSMQIYQYMNIGTAKITNTEACGVKHHMIDIVEPSEDYSSFLYQEQAGKIIDSLPTPPIICGGTGFYFDGLMHPSEFGIDGNARAYVNELFDNGGLKALQEKLKEIDGNAYEKIDVNNPVRLKRAIEIAMTGGSIAKGTHENREKARDIEVIVLERKRDKLYKQIDERVDKMFDSGLVDECIGILNKYGRLDNSAFNAIGYKEVYDYVEGKYSLQDAIYQVKLNTRHYAKRQISYFKRMDVAEFINVDNFANIDDLCNYILENHYRS